METKTVNRKLLAVQPNLMQIDKEIPDLSDIVPVLNRLEDKRGRLISQTKVKLDIQLWKRKFRVVLYQTPNGYLYTCPQIKAAVFSKTRSKALKRMIVVLEAYLVTTFLKLEEKREAKLKKVDVTGEAENQKVVMVDPLSLAPFAG